MEDTVLETGEPVIRKTIVDKFCNKYKVTPITIDRYLDQMVEKRDPFRLRTWYDKNHRYYTVLTVSRRIKTYITASILIPVLALILDFSMMSPVVLTDKAILSIIIFWISIGIDRTRRKNTD